MIFRRDFGSTGKLPERSLVYLSGNTCQENKWGFGYKKQFLLEQGTDPYDLLLLLGGIQFLGNRELFFDYSEAAVILTSRLEERSEMVKKILSVESMNIAFHFFSALKNIPWKVLHVPYGAVLYPASEQELRDFKEMLQSEDHFIIETKRGQLQSKKERQRILSGLVDHSVYGSAAEAVKPLFDTLDEFSAQVKKLEKVLEKMVAEDETVELLRTIPGVGLITAASLRAFVDDIDRYASPKKFAAHMGLAPWVQNSNETIHHGHIIKRRPKEMRTAMVQCVLGMVRNKRTTGGYRIMTKYRQMKIHKGSGKSIIATARKLSTIIYMMLKKREPFDPLKMEYSQKYLNMQAAAFEAAKAG
jgi:hypothetical protein